MEQSRWSWVVVVGVLLGTARGAVGAVWVSHGPEGGYTPQIVVAPTDPPTWYATAGALYESIDAGATWSPTAVGVTARTAGPFVVDPFDPKRLYLATTDDGIFTSADGGATWIRASAGLITGEVIALTADPTTVGRLYAIVEVFPPYPEVWHVVVSTDHGATWQATGSTLSTWPSAFVADPFTPGRLFLATRARILLSTDAGATWIDSSGGLNGYDIEMIVPDPARANVLFLGTGSGGVYRTDDGGNLWRWANGGLADLRITALALDPSAVDTVYVGTYDGVYKSTTGAGTWGPVSNTGLADDWVHALGIDASGLVLAGTNSLGIFRSENGGTSWTATNRGLMGTWGFGIATAFDDPRRAYAATFGAYVSRTDDGGRSWTALPGSPNIGTAVVVDPRSFSDVYVAGGGGAVAVSHDAGATWTQRPLPLPYQFINDVGVIATTPPTLIAVSSQWIARSTNDGQTWTDFTSFGSTYGSCMVVDHTQLGVAYVGTGGSGVWKTEDFGVTWMPLTPGSPPYFIHSIALDPNDPATIYVGGPAGDGSYKSSDGGATWHELEGPLERLYVMGIAVDPADSAVVYAATFGAGVYVSRDGGDSWSPFSTGMHNLVGETVVVRRDATGALVAYAGTRGGSVSVLQDCGDGVRDPDEECDDGNGSDGDCCSSQCALVTNGALCRPRVGECDTAELCGGDPFCPADTGPAAGTACTPDAIVCTADVCDGVGRCTHAPLPAGTVCREAAGACDVAETCDGGASPCPPNGVAPSGTVCRPAAGQCDAAEQCDGSGPACPADVGVIGGTACDDGNVCTNLDRCLSRTLCRGVTRPPCNPAWPCQQSLGCDPVLGCVYVPKPDGSTCTDHDACTIDDICADGMCAGRPPACGDNLLGCNEQCDDGNTTADDGCDEVCRLELCRARPAVGCVATAARGARLKMQLGRDATGSRMQWSLKRGAGTPADDLGNPLATDTYALCVYDAGRLWSSTTVPAGGTCGNTSCWTATARGFDYRDRERTPDGVDKLSLRTTGAEGTTKIRVEARGATLQIESPSTLMGPVTVQLVRSDGDACWESVYSPPFMKQTEAKLSAASD